MTSLGCARDLVPSATVHTVMHAQTTHTFTAFTLTAAMGGGGGGGGGGGDGCLELNKCIRGLWLVYKANWQQQMLVLFYPTYNCFIHLGTLLYWREASQCKCNMLHSVPSSIMGKGGSHSIWRCITGQH